LIFDARDVLRHAEDGGAEEAWLNPVDRQGQAESRRECQ